MPVAGDSAIRSLNDCDGRPLTLGALTWKASLETPSCSYSAAFVNPIDDGSSGTGTIRPGVVGLGGDASDNGRSGSSGQSERIACACRADRRDHRSRRVGTTNDLTVYTKFFRENDSSGRAKVTDC